MALFCPILDDSRPVCVYCSCGTDFFGQALHILHLLLCHKGDLTYAKVVGPWYSGMEFRNVRSHVVQVPGATSRASPSPAATEAPGLSFALKPVGILSHTCHLR